jgi:AcrR family transcriptional regulator
MLCPMWLGKMTGMTPRTPPAASGRRAEYAQATRDAILAAARQLFAEQGFFGTRVEDIARTARVAPATVYAVGGGKSGLLRELIETAVRSEENAAIHARIEEMREPRELIRFIITASQTKFADWSALMRQVVAAAPQEPSVRESLKAAEQGLHDGLAHIARRLADLDALRPGMDAERATDVLWYYLNNSSYFTLTDALAWPAERIAGWLYEVLVFGLLGEAAEGPRS